MALDQKKINDLKQFTLCNGLSDLGLLALANVATYAKLSKGDVLTHPLSNSPYLTLVVTGELKVVRFSDDGQEQPIMFLGSGAVGGASYVLLRQMNDDQIIALKNSTILRIARDDFMVLLDVYPQLNRQLSVILATQVNELQQNRATLLVENVEERLWNYLLQIAEKEETDTFNLAVTKRDLALYLGTVPATLSRRFASLEGQGRIKRGKGNLITVLQ